MVDQVVDALDSPVSNVADFVRVEAGPFLSVEVLVEVLDSVLF